MGSAKDAMLSTNYSINNFEKGKQENKAKLCDLLI
jgi:starch synthase